MTKRDESSSVPQEDREPCVDDLIDYLQQIRQGSGNIVVVMTDDDVQAPGDYVALSSFFAQWGQS